MQDATDRRHPWRAPWPGMWTITAPVTRNRRRPLALICTSSLIRYTLADKNVHSRRNAAQDNVAYNDSHPRASTGHLNTFPPVPLDVSPPVAFAQLACRSCLTIFTTGRHIPLCTRSLFFCVRPGAIPLSAPFTLSPTVFSSSIGKSQKR